MSENIHFIWVGPPARTPVKGQDTIGPDLMSKKYPHHPVYFWCLKKYVPQYEHQFFGKEIDVRCIEDHPQINEDGFSLFIEKLKANANDQAERRDIAREYTTLKAAFQLFLQIHHEGYFLDTNVIPNPLSDGTPLPRLDQFSFPCCDTAIDPWLMYSPAGDPLARQRFCKYVETAQNELCSRSTIHEINRSVLGLAFVEAASQSSGMQLEATRSSCTHIGLSYRVRQFQKRYFNTHHKSITGHVFYDILFGSESIDELQYLMDKSGFDASTIEYIHLQDTSVATTLLHTAISLGRWQELKILLVYAQNPDVIAESLLGQMDSILNIAHEINGLSILVDYYFQRKFSANIPTFLITLKHAMEMMRNHRKIDGTDWFKTIHDKSVVKDISAIFLKPSCKNLRSIIEIVLTTGPIVFASLETYVSHFEKLTSFTVNRQENFPVSSLLKWFNNSPSPSLIKLTIREQLEHICRDASLSSNGISPQDRKN